MEERTRLAFELLKIMMNLDWKFDISETTWDEAATKRAVHLTDLLLGELKGETGNETNH